MAITTYAELQTAIQNWFDDTSLSARAPEFITLGEAWIWRNFRVRGIEEFVDIPTPAVVDGLVAGGTADAITLTPATAVASYSYGLRIKWECATNNTGALTANVSGLGVKDVKKGERDNLSDLEANDCLDGATYYAFYDGTQFIMQPYGSAAPLPSRYRGARRMFLDGDPRRRLNYHPPQDFWQQSAVNDSGSPRIFTVEGDSLIFAPDSGSSKFVRLLYYRRPVALSGSAVSRLFTENPDLYLYASLQAAAPFDRDDGRAILFAAALAQIKTDMEREDRDDRFSGAPLEARSDYYGG